MKYTQPRVNPIVRSRDTLFRPDFMLQTSSVKFTKAQLSQRKTVSSSSSQEVSEGTDIAWGQDR